MEKMTKRQYFERIANLLADKEDIVAFCAHEVELLDKKKNAPRNPSAKQVEAQNLAENLADELIEVMTVGEPYTVSELCKLVKEDVSVSRLSYVIRTRLLGTSVERSEEKGKAYFTRIA